MMDVDFQNYSIHLTLIVLVSVILYFKCLKSVELIKEMLSKSCKFVKI